jgi:hypothetical protein
MQKLSSVGKFHDVPPDERERRASRVQNRCSECLPADGTTAAVNWRDYGRSRWQLSNKSNTDCRRSRKGAFLLFCSARGGFWPVADATAASRGVRLVGCCGRGFAAHHHFRPSRRCPREGIEARRAETRLRLRALARKPGPKGHAQTQLNEKISSGIMGEMNIAPPKEAHLDLSALNHMLLWLAPEHVPGRSALSWRLCGGEWWKIERKRKWRRRRKSANATQKPASAQKNTA